MILLFLILAIIVSAIFLYFTQTGILRALLVFVLSFIAFNVLYMCFWAIVGLFIDNSKPIRRQSALCRGGCVGISTLALGYCWVRTKVYGLEKLPEGERFLLVSNHRSLFDPLIFMKYLRKYEMAFIGKPSALALPVVGKIGYGAGCLPIDRANDREALKTVLTAADYLKKNFCSMAIFPEGTRNKTGDTLLPFRPGAFKIAQKAGTPVVVAALCGTESINRNMFRRVTDTELHLLEVIPADEVREASTKELADRSSELIRKCVEKAESETENAAGARTA